MKQISLFICATLWLFALPMWSQEPLAIHLTGDDELPDLEFYTLVEDNEQNIWLGADKGLFKYDGKEFKAYSHPDKRGRSFFGLKLDEKGRLWANNIAGQFFYVENDKLVLFGDYQEDLKGVLYEFTFINNHLVIAKDFDDQIINIDTKEIKIIPKEQGIRVAAPVVNKQLYLFDEKLQYTIYNYDLKPVKKVISPYFRPVIYKRRSSSNTFLFDSYLFLNICTLETNENSLFKIMGDEVSEIKLPREFKNVKITHIKAYQDRYYIATNEGAFIATLKGTTLVIKDHFLKDEFVTKQIHDTQGNLWSTTLNNGIFIIPSENLKTYPNVKNKITRLEKKNDSVCFIGGENAFVAELNIKSGKITPILNAKKETVSALFYDKKNERLIINTGIASYDLQNGKLNDIPLDLAAKNITKIDDERYMASFYVYSSIYDPKTKISYTFNETRSYKSHYSSKHKKIYLCNVDGVLVYDLNYKLLKNIHINNEPIYSFDIAETSDGIVWVATYENGIIGIDDLEVVKQLSTNEGLASNNLNGIKADGLHLWIAAENGLQYYDTKSQETQSITKRDGFKSFNVEDIEMLGNTVLLANNEGLYSFNKNTIFKNRNTPQPYITGVAIKEQDTIIKTTYALPQEESEIKFTFNTKGFQSDKFTAYKYQLTGFDNEWTAVEPGSYSVKFNTLPAGEYDFKLKAKNKFETKFSDPITIRLDVTLPFYKKWWFIVFMFGLTGFLFYAYFSNEKRRLKNKQRVALEKAELSKELVFSQLENLRSQMNPHFIFNALNSIQDYIILNEGKMARAYLVKFSSLMRKYLDHSQKNEVTLSEEIEALHLYLELETDRFEGNFSYHITIDPSLDLKNTSVPSLLIQPYVENALKHGLMHKKEDKSLLLKFERTNSPVLLVCTIEDNGIGRDASFEINKNRYKKHTSFASKANQKRIDLLNQARDTKLELTIDDLYNGTQPKGTRVTIKIPLYEA